ncbi:Pyridoxine-5'-phosphate oxidase [Araneus ventricosus]|uniref:pyridoxal 5'-phosphate synthase n=1 Tax=Araneus ventricosus TaxID=182803 RepID=A0A4Y2JY31_ARAVE|nr:Pyridoxine-5'-phosphate oxidase [Araneus ventricosus]
MLMKSHSKEGITFYTNYSSRKGQEIADNPQVALLFYWQPLYLQVRIEGKAVKTDPKESEEYFHSRPKSNQLSAATSNQDEVVESMKVNR